MIYVEKCGCYKVNLLKTYIFLLILVLLAGGSESSEVLDEEAAVTRRRGAARSMSARPAMGRAVLEYFKLATTASCTAMNLQNQKARRIKFSDISCNRQYSTYFHRLHS